METKGSWKTRLYSTYVSSGHFSQKHQSSAEIQLKSSKPYILHAIQKYIPADRSVTILDLGCGYGAYLYFLKQAGYANIQGIDASAEQVALAHEFGIHEVQLDEVDPFLAKLDEASVGVILLMDVLEHLTKQELFDTLDGVFRVLEPGGHCICHVPNAEGIFGMRVRYGDFTHELSFTSRSVSQVFSSIGFERITCHEDKPVIHSVLSLARSVIWTLGSLYPRLLLMGETGQRSGILSQNMMVTAEKPRSPGRKP
jgi:2-polyprenyl-3-methyl-5-hydroxy-6-metoxy-1,4-benzoquinol methylase